MINVPKNDRVITIHEIKEIPLGEEIDTFVQNSKDRYYSKSLEDYISHLPSITDGITETGIYKNNEKDRWEYWAVLPAHINVAPGMARKGMFAMSLYSNKALGFEVWMQDLEELLSPGMGFTGATKELH